MADLKGMDADKFQRLENVNLGDENVLENWLIP